MKNPHYRLLGLVGEGQFGKVYTGIHRQTGELVALKELNPHQFSTKKFLREMRILLTLEHDNIIRCQGIEHFYKRRYLVTEYCEGGNLRELIDSSTILNLEQKIKIIADILSGLAHVHSEKIIHRDIKPENILLTLNPQGWTAKISDFGVAKIEKEDENNNFSLGDTGSPAYMAPEQFYGKYSYSSDIYAVGIILYELLMGNRPFSGTPSEIMSAHLNESPLISDSLPISLQEILHTVLQKLPQHRFSTALEMRKTLLNTLLDIDNSQDLSSAFSTNKIVVKLIKEIDLETKINDIAIHKKQIFMANKHNITSVEYYFNKEEEKINLSLWKECNFTQSIIELKSTTDNLTILTKNNYHKNKYKLFIIKINIEYLIDINIDINNLVYLLSPNQKWLGLTKQGESKKRGFQIINLRNLKPINLLIEDFLPCQLLGLDNHHGLAVYYQPDIEKDHTFFGIFTRRGTWKERYSFGIPLHKVTLNNFDHNYFLAKEKYSNYVILIQINPLKLTRIVLNFTPEFIVALPNKFLCANRKGEIGFIDLNGNYLNYNKLDIKIDAIDYLTDSSVIVILMQKEFTSQLNFYYFN